MIPVSEGAGIILPYWLFFFLLGLTLICITGLVLLTRYYRGRLSVPVSAEPLPHTLPRFNATEWHPDVRPPLEKELAEIRTNYERLHETYNVLLARHKSLIREVQRHQQRRRTTQESLAQRHPQHPPQLN